MALPREIIQANAYCFILGAHYNTPLAGEANNLKSQSQQEGMCLEAQVNLYNMWTHIGKSDVKKFFQLISCLFTYWHKCKQRVKIFFSPSSKKISKNNFWK